TRLLPGRGRSRCHAATPHTPTSRHPRRRYGRSTRPGQPRPGCAPSGAATARPAGHPPAHDPTPPDPRRRGQPPTDAERTRPCRGPPLPAPRAPCERCPALPSAGNRRAAGRVAEAPAGQGFYHPPGPPSPRRIVQAPRPASRALRVLRDGLRPPLDPGRSTVGLAV